MRTDTRFMLVFRGKETLFPTRREAEDEQLFMEMMYNIRLPLYIVEVQYVDEQEVGRTTTKLG